MIRKCVLISVLAFLLVGIFISTGASAQRTPGSQPKKKLVVAVMQMPPYSMENDDGTWSGITVDLWNEIARIAGISYEFKKYDLKGIVQAQKNGDIDVAATGFAITAAREKIYDFSDPYLSAIEAVAVNSDQQSSLFQIVQSTFLNWTMLSFIGILFALAIIGASILWLLERRGESEHYGGKTPKAFAKSLFWSTMVMSGRELPKAVGWSTVAPATFAGRMFAMFWMMFGIALVSILTAATASVFTSRQLQGAIHDADDLRRVRVGTVAFSVGEEYLKHHRIRCDKAYASPEELLQALSNHQIDAAIYNRHILVYYTRELFAHKITVLSFPLRQDFLAIPMRAGFSQKEQVNQALMDITESRKWQEIVGTYLGNDWINASSTR